MTAPLSAAERERLWLDAMAQTFRVLRAEGCQCDPRFDLFPSAQDDDRLELVVSHSRDCPARPSTADGR